jgi:hypothetical protein
MLNQSFLFQQCMCRIHGYQRLKIFQQHIQNNLQTGRVRLLLLFDQVGTCWRGTFCSVQEAHHFRFGTGCGRKLHIQWWWTQILFQPGKMRTCRVNCAWQHLGRRLECTCPHTACTWHLQQCWNFGICQRCKRCMLWWLRILFRQCKLCNRRGSRARFQFGRRPGCIFRRNLRI